MDCHLHSFFGTAFCRNKICILLLQSLVWLFKSSSVKLVLFINLLSWLTFLSRANKTPLKATHLNYLSKYVSVIKVKAKKMSSWVPSVHFNLDQMNTVLGNKLQLKYRIDMFSVLLNISIIEVSWIFRQNHSAVDLNIVKVLNKKKDLESFHISEKKQMYDTVNLIMQHFLFFGLDVAVCNHIKLCHPFQAATLLS